MDVYSAQVVFDRGRNFDRIDLMNSPGTSVEAVQDRLRSRLPAGIDVVRPEARGQALENTLTAMRLGMLITSFIALLVGVYIIFNSFTIAVNQRWKEIGILRAIGVARGNVSGMFLVRSARDGRGRFDHRHCGRLFSCSRGYESDGFHCRVGLRSGFNARAVAIAPQPCPNLICPWGYLLRRRRMVPGARRVLS